MKSEQIEMIEMIEMMVDKFYFYPSWWNPISRVSVLLSGKKTPTEYKEYLIKKASENTLKNEK